MKPTELIEKCSSTLIIGFYKTGKDQPEEEITIEETDDFNKRQRIKEMVEKNYPNAFISDIWALKEDTIAAYACI